MTCDLCGGTGADHQVTERTATGFVAVRYCEACCRARAGLPDRPPVGLFTLVDRTSGINRVVTMTEIIEFFGGRGGS